MAEDLKKWILHFGIHRGTLMSRDADRDDFDSLEECRERVQQLERDMRSIGYLIWYAYAVGPEGERVDLHRGHPYW